MVFSAMVFVYAGHMPYGDELHEGEHDGLIDRDRYHRLRAILDARAGARQQRPRNLAYLLRGILRCAHCDAAMTPASTRKNGSDYRYYRCVTRDKKGRKACPARPLPAHAVEGFVVERDLAMLDQVEIEGKWVAQALSDFDAVWDALTIENQARLVRALVRRVEVNETTGEATAILTDLGIEDIAGDDAPTGPPPQAREPAALTEATT